MKAYGGVSLSMMAYDDFFKYPPPRNLDRASPQSRKRLEAFILGARVLTYILWGLVGMGILVGGIGTGGVEGALIKWAGDNVVPLNRYHETVMTWVGDFNPKMLKVISNLGAWEYRRLSTYRLMLDASIPFQRAPIIS